MRTALSIKMLQELYGSYKPLSREELANRLDTNVRNISEFKKELEQAGYVIESTSGKYGGYKLEESSLFPSLMLEKEEVEAINEALHYFDYHEFIDKKLFSNAMNKVKTQIRNRDISSDIVYQNNSSHFISDQVKKIIEIIQTAKESLHTLSFDYAPIGNNEKVRRSVHVYDVVTNQGGIYLLGYDVTRGKEKRYKTFKIIETRMTNLMIEDKSYTWDITYRLKDHIGEQGLFKDLYEVEIELSNMSAKLWNEQHIDNLISKKFDNDKLYLNFFMEGEYQVHAFILSLGSSCKVLGPMELKNSIQEELVKMVKLNK